MLSTNTKTYKAAKLIAAGDFKKGLAILKTFRALPKEQKRLFGYGYEAMVHPSFYAQTRGKSWVVEIQLDAIAEAKRWAAEKLEQAA